MTESGSRIRVSSGSTPWLLRRERRSAPGIDFPGLCVIILLYWDRTRFHRDCRGVSRRAALKYERFL